MAFDGLWAIILPMSAIDPRDGDIYPIRISDFERNEALERLNDFFSEGRLTLDEYSTRLDEVYAARTDIELADVFRGLPSPAPAVPDKVDRQLRTRIDRFVGFVTPASICTVIWAMTGTSYFWPEWVWLGTGIGLLGGYRIAGRRRRRQRKQVVSRSNRDSLPRGAGTYDKRQILTAVFTDIVGSTEKATSVGDSRWREVLRGFEHVVDGELELYRGRKLFTKGDEVVATFRSPAQAIQYALALRNDIRPLDLEIRAGIHTGEIEGHRSDLSGIALHIGQRVSGLAEPGEIFVSSTVRDLAYGSGIDFVDRGEHELRGLTGKWHLYSVGDAGA
jgi:class 3 adenylate cyclase